MMSGNMKKAVSTISSIFEKIEDVKKENVVTSNLESGYKSKRMVPTPKQNYIHKVSARVSSFCIAFYYVYILKCTVCVVYVKIIRRMNSNVQERRRNVPVLSAVSRGEGSVSYR